MVGAREGMEAWKKIARYSGAIVCQSKCRNFIAPFHAMHAIGAIWR
jgi:hypothetical protein